MSRKQSDCFLIRGPPLWLTKIPTNSWFSQIATLPQSASYDSSPHMIQACLDMFSMVKFVLKLCFKACREVQRTAQSVSILHASKRGVNGCAELPECQLSTAECQCCVDIATSKNSTARETVKAVEFASALSKAGYHAF